MKIGSATKGEALRTLCTPEAPRVSAHYFVSEDGRIVQLVPENVRAWHAGPSAWAGCDPAPMSEERGLLPADEGVAVASLQTDRKRYGYGICVTGKYDVATEQVVQAFQRHFRPVRVDGIADPSTLGAPAAFARELGFMRPPGRAQRHTARAERAMYDTMRCRKQDHCRCSRT